MRVLKRVTVMVAFAALLSAGAVGASAQAPLKFTAINNDCSAGYVAFTFDDGPDPTSTPQVISALQSLNLQATFFVIGAKIAGAPAVIAQEAQAGFVIGNHTWDHASWTGASTGTAPLTDTQIQQELASTSQAIVNAGGPSPSLYRPPYGDITSHDDLIAQQAGYRIVMPWGSPTTGNIVDSQDWTGISAAQIASNVINGYTDSHGNFVHGIQANSIVSMHDGEPATAPNTIAALPTIADWMNQNHYCSTATIRQDATGGIVPVPPPAEPTSGNLVVNPSLEQIKPNGEPTCFQQAGATPTGHVTNWSIVNPGHAGNNSEQLVVTNWQAGDGKLVVTQRASEKSGCLAAPAPGATYRFWTWYKTDQIAAGAKISIVTYYLNSSGTWVYWQSSPLEPWSTSWNLAYYQATQPLPAGAQGVSFGLAIAGNGTLTTDDYAMTHS